MTDAIIETLFVTKLYRVELARAAKLNAELAHTCGTIARDDKAGRHWCKAHGYLGYTSYASLDDLTVRALVFADLAKRLDAHAAKFARVLDWDVKPGKPALDSMWVNAMEKGSAHSGHIHPHSVLSGTYYVAVPKGAAAIRLEDPRLAMMMATPAKRAKAARENQPFVTVAPKPGTVLMWKSFLRHEVPTNDTKGPRISVSFNYALR